MTGRSAISENHFAHFQTKRDFDWVGGGGNPSVSVRGGEGGGSLAPPEKRPWPQ